MSNEIKLHWQERLRASAGGSKERLLVAKVDKEKGQFIQFTAQPTSRTDSDKGRFQVSIEGTEPPLDAADFPRYYFQEDCLKSEIEEWAKAKLVNR